VEPSRLAAAEWSQRARALKDEGWWLVDLCGLDQLGGEPRFEIVVQLLHLEGKQRTTVHIAAEEPAEPAPPSVPSVVELWPTADFMEREAYDMFGIAFEGHPNLRRILMPDEWEGFPLRKDYGVGKTPIEFIPQPYLQVDAPGQGTDADGAEEAVDHLGQPIVPARPRGDAE
jgi:NADH:ubiquinone oxidoreductase subunit C